MYQSRAAIAVVPLVLTLGAALGAPAYAADSTAHNGQHRSFVKERALVHGHGSADAKPYGSCSLIVPSAVRVVSSGRAVPVRLTGGCTLHPDVYSGWYVGSYDDPADYIFFGGVNRTSWQLFAFTPLGTRTWTPDAASDVDDHVYSQNSPQTTVKVGSWAGLWTSRKGSKVTVNTRTVRYSTARDVNIPWTSTTGIIQYRPAGGSAWSNLKQVTTNSAGNASYTYTSSAKRDYRVVYGEAAYVWGATSPTSQR
ncbi:MAG: hypothetical protein M3Y49_17990 [Actinomycetota bacterium]|nr:hypothetical protein [Actinomycetota bacterium]